MCLTTLANHIQLSNWGQETNLQTRPALVEIMAWHLLVATPLSNPTLAFVWLNPWEQISGKLESKYSNFHTQKNQFQNVICQMVSTMQLPLWIKHLCWKWRLEFHLIILDINTIKHSYISPCTQRNREKFERRSVEFKTILAPFMCTRSNVLCVAIVTSRSWMGLWHHCWRRQWMGSEICA